MPTNTDALTLMQWFSPGYPVGAFAYSHGLEWAAESSQVSDAESLECWIADVLSHGAGQSDALFLAAAYHAVGADAVSQIDATCRAFAPSRERLQETVLQGAAFCRITSILHQTDLTELSYPVAAGHAARLCDLPLGLTSQMYLHAFAANLVAAGQRLLQVGQSQAQGIIKALAPLCIEIAHATEMGDLGDLSSTAFLADIAAMNHETQYARIFRT